MRSIMLSVSAALIVGTAAGAAHAANLYVPLDRSVRVSVPGSAASVVIGNPAVADVTVVDSHTLFVSGHGYGATDLTVLDINGRPLISAEVMVAAPNTGHVSVYRGANRTDLACSPGCQSSPRAGQAAVGVGGFGAPSSAGSSLLDPNAAANALAAGLAAARPSTPG